MFRSVTSEVEMELLVERGPSVETVALTALSERLDDITDALDAYRDNVPDGLAESLTHRLAVVADDIELARHHSHAATPTRRRTMTGVGATRRRRRLADRFAAIAADGEFDHLSQRVHQLGLRLGRRTLHAAERPLRTHEARTHRPTVG